MKFQLITFLLLILINACKPEVKTFNRKKCTTETDPYQRYSDSMNLVCPTYWVTGMIEDKDRQRQIIDAQYGFRFRIKSGCLVNDSILEFVERHNLKTDSIMKSRYGTNWIERFESSVDSLFAIDSVCIQLVDDSKFYKSFLRKYNQYDKANDFYPKIGLSSYQTNDKNIKLVVAEGYGLINDRVQRVSYYRATVNYPMKKIISVDSTVTSYW